jgi:outer membrane protein OmpA-like peptidoglycan-associated protein
MMDAAVLSMKRLLVGRSDMRPPGGRYLGRGAAQALSGSALVLMLAGCAAQPTIPDPSMLKVPTKEIVITEGSLDTPHEVLGRVDATLGGLRNPDLRGAVGAAKLHLRNAAYTKYGERLDAIIDVRTSAVTTGGPFSESAGRFAATRGLRAEGIAIAISLPPADSREELGFTEAAQVATDAMVSQLQKLPSFLGTTDKHGVVIDPMLDASSGQQTAATRLLEQQVANRLRTHVRLELLPFQIPRLSEAQYLLTGTMRRVAGKAPGSRELFQINLALTNMKTGTVVARASSLARDEDLDTTPTAYYRDSPIWVKDQVVDGYIGTAETPPGRAADPVYFERVATATVISDALVAYNGERYQDALALYRAAAATPAGDQVRVVNGIYLATWKLGRASEAEEAFGNIVALGLRKNDLGVKFLFNPGTTQFWSDPKISGPYDIWLRQIARQAAAAKVCMNVVGHASRTGAEQFNDRLSEQRAIYIKQRLEAEARELAGRIRGTGRGFRETIVGIGTDDARDALDRRVEFKISGC